MNCRVLLIRHGETVWNQKRLCQGFSDIALSERGEAQAEALARALREVPLAGVYSSDLVRARRTAELIAEPHGLLVITDARLRELNQGELEGKDLANLLADHPELLKQWMENPAEVVMPGGESMRQLQARAWKAVSELAERHPEETIAVVAHNLCNLAIICKAIGLDLNNFRRIKMENGSISELLFTANGPVLVRANDTNHLKNQTRI